jgi:NhaA family Na+:H+ antiporter
LFFGKQIGVFLPVWLAIRSGLVRMPEGANWMMLYGVAVATGIGFTMSFFIGTLAYEYADPAYATTMKIGVLTGSALSMVWALIVLFFATRNRAPSTLEATPAANS